jgi:hypothetical protein
MVVALLPGVDRNTVLSKLRELRAEIGNQHTGAAREIGEWLFDYLSWAGKAAQVLTGLIRHTDVDRLVLTRRYQMLVDATGGLLPLAGRNPAERVLSELVALEVGECTSEFAREITAMEQQIVRWGQDSTYVVLKVVPY